MGLVLYTCSLDLVPKLPFLLEAHGFSVSKSPHRKQIPADLDHLDGFDWDVSSGHHISRVSGGQEENGEIVLFVVDPWSLDPRRWFGATLHHKRVVECLIGAGVSQYDPRKKIA